MKITDIESIVLSNGPVDPGLPDPGQNALLVLIHTDDGFVGVGEADTPPQLGATILELASSHAVARGIRELLIGQNPLEIDRLWQTMYSASYTYGQAGAVLQVISAVDMALWDIAGKAYGQPVSVLLGGRRVDAIPVYGSAMMPDDAEEIDAVLQPILARGFTALKLGWGPLGHDPQRDAQRIAATRTAIGPQRKLMIDLGMRSTVRGTQDLLRRVEASDLFWLEEPLRWDDFSGYRRLANVASTRIATGEAHSGTAAFRALADSGVDVLQPDLARCGGLSIARRIADIAYDFGIDVVPHCFSSGVSVAACLHFVSTLARPLMTEFPVSQSPFVEELIGSPYQVSDGKVTIPDRPGLGIELDAEVVERFRTDGNVPITAAGSSVGRE